jgi:hypothetical protein
MCRPLARTRVRLHAMRNRRHGARPRCSLRCRRRRSSVHRSSSDRRTIFQPLCRHGAPVLLPTPPLTPDQVLLLERDNVASADAEHERRTFATFGIDPASMMAIVPTYLWRFRKSGQFRRLMA